MNARDQRLKWIIRTTLKNNLQFAAAGHEGRFALVPIENNLAKNVYAWDEREEAYRYWQYLQDTNPQLKNLQNVEIILCQVADRWMS